MAVCGIGGVFRHFFLALHLVNPATKQLTSHSVRHLYPLDDLIELLSTQQSLNFMVLERRRRSTVDVGTGVSVHSLTSKAKSGKGQPGDHHDEEGQSNRPHSQPTRVLCMREIGYEYVAITSDGLHTCISDDEVTWRT